MGASGSGKTTLLSASSGRLPSSTKSRYHTTGSILYNDICVSEDEIRKFASFVHQEDIHLLPSLAVRATLRFIAHMTLPNSISDGEKNADLNNPEDEQRFRHLTKHAKDSVEPIYELQAHLIVLSNSRGLLVTHGVVSTFTRSSNIVYQVI
ncbi:hypothetical protein N7478_004164 [Penicillium angulare]|uniref:uncharacterized protein n=1 Tax=Penicillium angulare TaxID=116970 RepID=UPI002540920A|nr:uncharacterized protein N7478_004164 [Penicillium angulare]KAJ5278792.1 hypothetical protein N7478_004164 [Penicillium angulare]